MNMTGEFKKLISACTGAMADGGGGGTGAMAPPKIKEKTLYFTGRDCIRVSAALIEFLATCRVIHKLDMGLAPLPKIGWIRL